MERLWTKPFFLMTVATLFLFTAFYMLYPTLPLFIKQIGGNEAHVGWATGVFMLSAVVFRPFVGALSVAVSFVLFSLFGKRLLKNKESSL